MDKQEKQEIYNLLLSQIKALVEGETNTVGVLANVSSALHHAFDTFFWTGFYLRQGDTLRLGPFQGTVACYTIPVGKGVCGTACKEASTIVVPDVEKFEGHIACSSQSRSEIVVPLFDGNRQVVCVLDIDSTEPAAFDDTDREWLEKIAETVALSLYR
ncbi:GAF domain-containing protein [Hoylesella oralis]|uniref:GAF domain-containing protein n=1 Tax=Hoylesella oralis TaxID=28134 RepID=UPI0028E7CDE8|nr:GAF domain-containing protein [Hoylesella oralis]